MPAQSRPINPVLVERSSDGVDVCWSAGITLNLPLGELQGVVASVQGGAQYAARVFDSCRSCARLIVAGVIRDNGEDVSFLVLQSVTKVQDC